MDINDNHQLSKSEASDKVNKFRDNAAEGVALSYTIGRKAFETILAQEGCTGIRVYNATNTNDTQDIVIIGVDANDEDMEDIICNRSVVCPPFCRKPFSK